MVFFFSKDFGKKQWCGLEWQAVRDLLKHKEDNRLMFARFDEAEADIPGIYSIDGYLDLRLMSDGEAANAILQRLDLLSSHSNLRSAAEQLSLGPESQSASTTKGPIRGASDSDNKHTDSMIPALGVLRRAIAAVPAVKYALGVAGIVSAIAIIRGLNVDFRVAAFGTVIMVVLMALLVIFARLASLAANKLALPAMVFTWFVLLITIATASLLFTSVFWRWPVDLKSWLGQSVMARVYQSPGGSWEKTDDGWIEHATAHPEVLIHLNEIRHDSDYIYLVDRSRTRGENNTDNFMMLRLPINGGTAQWSWSNPISWTDLTIVTPQQ